MSCGFFGRRTYYDFLDEYEEIVRELDDSSVKLRQSLDSMSAITEMLLRQLEGFMENEDMQHARDNANLRRCSYTAKFLMQTIHDSVVSNKDTTFQLLIRHFKYGAYIFNEKLKSVDYVIDRFGLERRQEREFEFELPETTDYIQIETENELRNQIKAKEIEITRNKEQLDSMGERCKEMSTAIKKLNGNEKKSKKTIDDLTTEVKSLKKENYRLQGNADINLKEFEIQSSSLQSNKEKTETLKTKMTNELDAAKRSIIDMEEKQKRNEKTISQLKTSLQSETEQVEALEAQMKNELDTAKRQISDKEYLLIENENTISQLETSLKIEKEQIEALKSEKEIEKDAAERKISDKEDLLKENKYTICQLETSLQSEKEQAETLNTQMENELDAAKSQRKQVQEEKDELASTLQAKTKEFEAVKNEKTKQKEQLQLQIKTMTDNEKQRTGLLQEMEETLSTLKQEKVNLLAQLDQQNDLTSKQSEQIESMSQKLQELIRITSKQIITMQVWFNQRTAVTGGIEQDLMGVLKTQFDTELVEIRFKRCAGRADIEVKHPLIVICVAASRIGTDAANAVQGVNMSSNTALVVVHPKDSHALPQQASERVLTSPEYKQLAGVFDIAYQRGKGVYDCTMNTTNIIGLVAFVAKIGVRRPMFD